MKTNRIVPSCKPLYALYSCFGWPTLKINLGIFLQAWKESLEATEQPGKTFYNFWSTKSCFSVIFRRDSDDEFNLLNPFNLQIILQSSKMNLAITIMMNLKIV